MAAGKNKFKETPKIEEEDPFEPQPEPKAKAPKKEKVKPAPKEKSGPNGIVRFFTNEKTHKIFGLILLLLSVYMFIAFSSFMLTWQNDISELDRPLGDILLNPEVKVENWLGKIGALFANQFINNWFGVAAFIFPFLFFVNGLYILTKIKLVPLTRSLAYSLFFLMWTPVMLGLIFRTQYLFVGGGMGYHINQYLGLVIGTVGTGILLGFTLLVFGVIAFNMSFNLPKREPKESSIPPIVPIADNESPFKETAAVPFGHEEVTAEEANDPRLFEFVVKENEPERKNTFVPPVVPTPPPTTGPELELNNIDAFDESPFADTKPSGDLEMELKNPLFDSNDEPLTDTSQLQPYDPTLDLSNYRFPSLDLLENYGDNKIKVDREELEGNKTRILDTLKNYGIEIAKISATIGPTVTLYEIVPAPGVRISKIKNLEDDIALSLSALGIRIIAPMPGKGTIGIEVPNQNTETVAMRTILASDKFQNTSMDLPIALGKTISNETFVVDLAKMPHLLMAGATGQGKSVGLNAILVSLLYKKHPSQIKFVLVDPKKVELTLFTKIERHFLAKLPDTEEAIITDTKKVVHTLNSLCIEMDNRYELLKDAQVRNLKEYNAKFIARKLNPNEGHRYLPYIVLVVDEFADLIMTAGKEIETPIARLAQLARAIGIHLIIATQRPSVNIITGTIKANFPARIAFRVSSKVDSRTILDAGGADQLIGRGDMLLSTGNDMIRLQCAFVDTPEVDRICDFIGAQQGYPSAMHLPEYVPEGEEGGKEAVDLSDRDSYFDEAARLVVRNQQGSASLIQRKMKLGYNRAGRIVDQLEAAGIIGPFEGSKARQVLIKDEVSLEDILSSLK
jgi:S-DNA-T family DNA segregation ATPase FtsK/SpoIIIE